MACSVMQGRPLFVNKTRAPDGLTEIFLRWKGTTIESIVIQLVQERPKSCTTGCHNDDGKPVVATTGFPLIGLITQ